MKRGNKIKSTVNDLDTIITNKVASLSDLQTIENIVKNIENINSEDIESSRLLQYKFYLKIIDISFFY